MIYYQILEMMQGKKIIEDEKQLCFPLSAHVPKHNFYRQLKQRLNLNFLDDQTREYYGHCGKHTTGPVVFFKICLVAREGGVCW